MVNIRDVKKIQQKRGLYQNIYNSLETGEGCIKIVEPSDQIITSLSHGIISNLPKEKIIVTVD